jgi:hypothetical protein
MGARNQVGIGLPYQPARLHRLAEPIPWNRFLGCRSFKNTISVECHIGNKQIADSLAYKSRHKRRNLDFPAYILPQYGGPLDASPE